MTWIEIRDALAEGKRTAIVPDRGDRGAEWTYVGQVSTTKVLEGMCERIARMLVMPYVPGLSSLSSREASTLQLDMRYPEHSVRQRLSKRSLKT